MQDFGELHHKMCKKVAQLTKVIFHLNTRNDEYENNLRAVVYAYEQEMDNMAKEANNVFLLLKDHQTVQRRTRGFPKAERNRKGNRKNQGKNISRVECLPRRV